MSQGIDISIPKLSAPVEALAINRRTCCSLRQAGIYTVAEIFARVSAIRLVKASRIKNLLLHPRFYRSLQGTCGLRGWLREPFSHIPEEFTERVSSIRRVERARLQGFNVEKLIREDRLELPTPGLASSEIKGTATPCPDVDTISSCLR